MGRILAFHTIMYLFGLYRNELTESWAVSNLFILFLLLYFVTHETKEEDNRNLLWVYLWSVFNDCICLVTSTSDEEVNDTGRFSLLCAILLLFFKFPSVLILRKEAFPGIDLEDD